MAFQQIGIGTSANDGTGDSLRTAAIKINNNFSSVFTGDLSNVTLATVSGALDLNYHATFCNNGSSITLTLEDSEILGKTIRIISLNSSVVIIPTNFAGGTSITISQNGVLDLVWGGDNWFAINNGNTYLTIS